MMQSLGSLGSQASRPDGRRFMSIIRSVLVLTRSGAGLDLDLGAGRDRQEAEATKTTAPSSACPGHRPCVDNSTLHHLKIFSQPAHEVEGRDKLFKGSI